MYLVNKLIIVFNEFLNRTGDYNTLAACRCTPLKQNDFKERPRRRRLRVFLANSRYILLFFLAIFNYGHFGEVFACSVIRHFVWVCFENFEGVKNVV